MSSALGREAQQKVDELKSLAVLLGSVFDDVFKNSGVNVDWWM